MAMMRGWSFSTCSDLVGSLMLMLLLSTMLLQQAERVSAGCDNIQNNLESCQPAVEGDNPPPPTSACCSTLKKLTDTKGCLCKALSDGVLKNVNQQAAFMLPTKCQFDVPDFNCAGHEEYPIPGDS